MYLLRQQHFHYLLCLVASCLLTSVMCQTLMKHTARGDSSFDLRSRSRMDLSNRAKRSDMEEDVPPFPPQEAGKCHYSVNSSREICYPWYEQLDASCIDVSGKLVMPPSIKHAFMSAVTVAPMFYMEHLIRQHCCKQGKDAPENATFSPKAFVFVRYQCETGYDFADEVETVFCSNGTWVITPPICRGKGLCKENNGGCSDFCLSVEGKVECRCPEGSLLDVDGKNCTKLCGKLFNCICTSADEVQISCTCPNGEKCILFKKEPSYSIILHEH